MKESIDKTTYRSKYSTRRDIDNQQETSGESRVDFEVELTDDNLDQTEPSFTFYTNNLSAKINENYSSTSHSSKAHDMGL